MVRVLIERRVDSEADDVLQKTMRELRREAIHRPGYITGETLRDLDQVGHYWILSTWRTREDWESWHHSPIRERCEQQIDNLLLSPERIRVCEPL